MGLGKGLSALISDKTIGEISQGYIPEVPLDEISPNPYQPRIAVNPESLVDLADSIREHGVLEPLIVSRKGNKYELIAGERRWRAAKLAKMSSVPVIVKEVTPQQVLELAIIENIQRKDLNPIEEALAFDQLEKLFGLKHSYISERLGVSRSAITNKIRLLQLPDEVKKALLEEKIEEGHARALLGMATPAAMAAACRVIIRDRLSVRAVEEMVRRLNQDHKRPGPRAKILDEFTQTIESNLRKRYGEKVQLVRTKRGGRIVIPFTGDKQLKKIISQILEE
jgi:ParB family chromosome partitioning protein